MDPSIPTSLGYLAELNEKLHIKCLTQILAMSRRPTDRIVPLRPVKCFILQYFLSSKDASYTLLCTFLLLKYLAQH